MRNRSGDAFDAEVETLQAKGVVFERYDMPGVDHQGPAHVFGEMKVAWFKDPDGNIFSLGNYRAD